MKKELDLAEVLAKTGSEEWNNSIASRLEVMRGYLSQEAWQKGIRPFLLAIVGNGLRKFLREGGNSDYLRGFIAAIEMVLSIPASVDGQIQRESDKQKAGPAKGQAGY